MNSLELDREKIIRCRNGLLENYFNASIVEQAINAIDYDETIHRNLDFQKFLRWHYIPKEWFTDPSIYPDLVFSDIARGIAIGEEEYIVEQILANSEVKRTTLDTVNYADLRNAFNDLVLEVERPISTLQFTLFAPIEYFVTMHIDWAREHHILIRPDQLILNGFRVRPFWSSKYVDYDEFIILEKSFCRWIAKPSVDNRLEADIREIEKPGKMELKAQTVFNFTILDSKKIRVLRSTQPPET